MGFSEAMGVIRASYRTHASRGRRPARVATSSQSTSRLRAISGVLLGLLVWVWLRTLRLRVVDRTSEASRAASSPWVLAFFHGTQVPLLAWRRRRRTAVLVSLSKDGELQAGVQYFQ